MDRKPTGIYLVNLIQDKQKALGWRRGDILRYVGINASTFMRWKKNDLSPNFESYFKVTGRLDKLKVLKEKEDDSSVSKRRQNDSNRVSSAL